jgi:hypothetical protein
MAAIASRLKTGNAVRFTVFSSAVFLMLITMGCAVAVRVGGPKISEEVTRTFESYQIMPDHRYYHIGWDTRPYAIVALKEPYHITSKLWLKFDANPETIKKRVDALEIFNERAYNRAFGYNLLDKAGNRIGVWYSSISIFTATVNKADNTVVISMDKPWVTGDRFGL